jgi:hypothetical protein
MNERIRQLAEQAGQVRVFEINGVPILHYYAKGDGWVDIEPLVKEFAELIVKECAGVGYDASYYECALNVSNKIKEHFGVEE